MTSAQGATFILPLKILRLKIKNTTAFMILSQFKSMMPFPKIVGRLWIMSETECNVKNEELCLITKTK